MIDSQRRVGYNHLISNKREWNNCFIKSNQEILLDLADFALQEQPEDNLMVAISQAWYNGSYIMAAKPIKSLELHYTMIQFLLNKYAFMHTMEPKGEWGRVEFTLSRRLHQENFAFSNHCWKLRHKNDINCYVRS